MKNHYKHLTIEAVQELLDVVKEENRLFGEGMAVTLNLCDRNLDLIEAANRGAIARHREVYAVEKFLNDRLNELKADKQQEERDQVADLREQVRELREKVANCHCECDICQARKHRREKAAERLEELANELEGREK